MEAVQTCGRSPRDAFSFPKGWGRARGRLKLKRLSAVMCFQIPSRQYGAVELTLSQAAEHKGVETHHPTDGSMGLQQVLEQTLPSTSLFIKSCFKMPCTSAVAFSSGMLALGQKRHLKHFFLKTQLLKTPQHAQQCCSFRCEACKEEFTNDILIKLLLAFKWEDFNHIFNKIISERELKVRTTKLF